MQDLKVKRSKYQKPIKVGDEIIFSSVDPEEAAITLGKVYKVIDLDWGWAPEEVGFIDDLFDERAYPLTRIATEDAYMYEILTLEND